MNDQPLFEREARDWLELGPTQAPERSISKALVTIQTTPQRRGLRAPWRYRRMSPMLRVAVITIAATIIGLGSWTTWTSRPSTRPGYGDSPTPAPLPPVACPGTSALPSGTIATIAGNGQRGSTGDGGQALDATLSTWDMSSGFTGEPIAFDANGALYFSDIDSSSVRKVGTDGVISTVAGPSTGAPIVIPGGLAFDAAGDLLIADPGAARVWKMGPTGAFSSIAGTGIAGSTGDGGRATQAQVQPGDLAIGPRGEIYIDDAYRIRVIAPDGTIHAFAGTGEAGFAGDGGPAVSAQLGDSAGASAVGPDGSLYIGDPSNARIRRVDPAGNITTVVGSGASPSVGGEGDGGPALEATLYGSPYGIVVTDDGSITFSDWQAGRVRRVDPAGVIATIVGGGLGTECGPAAEASLANPQAIGLRDGALFIVEGGRNRIRMVVP
jgi:sugar lactone lactonase YvrE